MQGLRSLIRSVFGLAPDSPDAATLLPNRAHLTADNEFVVPGKRVVTGDGFRIELDLSTQVLAVEAPIDRDFDLETAVQARRIDAPLTATLNPIDSTALVSASVLAQKAKIFDDGLYAAVEVAAQLGTGHHAGKATLLASLCRALAGSDPSVAGTALELLLGAARLGHVPVESLSPDVEARAQHAVEAFLANEARSKPLGFYTWSQQLKHIFQQDRLLQGEIDALDVKAIANALHADSAARATYVRHLRLVSRLTNPFAHPDLRSVLEAYDDSHAHAAARDTRFFPASVAHETEIVKLLFGARPIPDGFVLADEMIRRIRSGELDLTPRAESGWYDYQTWALEPLVVPERMTEGERLQLHPEYRNVLVDLFKGLLTLTRETHVKQLEIPMVGSAGGMWWRTREVFDIAPALSAEPLATFYLRRALGYRYVRSVLEDAFGPRGWEKLHRLSEAGPVSVGLADELSEIEVLFLGAHVSVSRQLGLPCDAAVGSDTSANAAAERFAGWARDLRFDADLKADLRAMVPVFYDVERRKLKVWAFLGWARRPITVSFAQPPQATVVDSEGNRLRNPPRIRWTALYDYLSYPVTAELYVDRLLDRNEFRKLCDSCRTRSEILRRLATSANPA